MSNFVKLGIVLHNLSQKRGADCRGLANFKYLLEITQVALFVHGYLLFTHSVKRAVFILLCFFSGLTEALFENCRVFWRLMLHALMLIRILLRLLRYILILYL